MRHGFLRTPDSKFGGAGANAQHRAAIREARVACWISAVASAAVKSAPAKRGVRSPG